MKVGDWILMVFGGALILVLFVVPALVLRGSLNLIANVRKKIVRRPA
jgi:hypothetical protein